MNYLEAPKPYKSKALHAVYIVYHSIRMASREVRAWQSTLTQDKPATTTFMHTTTMISVDSDTCMYIVNLIIKPITGGKLHRCCGKLHGWFQ